jgi:magnesium chelatase family protein
MRACTCSSGSITRYQKRLSGPLLDRIDIHVEVPRIEYEKLAGDELAEASGCVRERVEAARNRQWTRYRGGKISSNAEMGVRELRRHCALDEAGEMMMRAAVNHMALSARAYHRVLKVARTIADLAEAERIAPAHVAEAIQYQRRAPA